MEVEENIQHIGQIAQSLDADYSMSDRMKIRKETLKRIGYAITCYITIMMLFALIL